MNDTSNNVKEKAFDKDVKKEHDTLNDKHGTATYYNVNLHKFVLVLEIIGVFALCIFAVPWLLRGVRIVFTDLFGWSTSESDGYVNLLPDFFGGLVGILLGFLIDKSLFEKWRELDKFKALDAIIKRDLYIYWVYCETNYNFCTQDHVPNPSDASNEGSYMWLNEVVLTGIVTSPEIDAMIYSLPAFWHFRRKNKDGLAVYHKGQISEALHAINGQIATVNNAITVAKDVKDSKDLKPNEQSEKMKKALENIKEETVRLAAMIHRYLDFTEK